MKVGYPDYLYDEKVFKNRYKEVSSFLRQNHDLICLFYDNTLLTQVFVWTLIQRFSSVGCTLKQRCVLS